MEEENKVNPSEEVVTTPPEENKETATPPVEESKKEPNPTVVEEPNKGETQSKEDDAKFAKLRHERDINKAKAAGDAEGYKRARIKSVGGKNPYSDNAPIETEEDYEFYELQDEVNSRGLDPKNPLEIEKVRRELASKKADEIAKNKSEEQKAKEKADKEVKEYLDEGHTQDELKQYWADEKFQEFASDLLGYVPLKTIIAKYEKVKPKTNPSVKKEAANKVSSPGSASNDEQEVPKKSIKDMTREEFAKFQEDVAKGKVKIS